MPTPKKIAQRSRYWNYFSSFDDCRMFIARQGWTLAAKCKPTSKRCVVITHPRYGCVITPIAWYRVLGDNAARRVVLGRA